MVLTKKSNKLIGKYLKEKRQDAGVSQKKVSVELGYTTPQFISNWERGLILPPLSTVGKLIKIYGMTKKEVSELFMGEYKKILSNELRKE